MDTKRFLFVLFLVLFGLFIIITKNASFARIYEFYNSDKGVQNEFILLAVGDSLTAGTTTGSTTGLGSVRRLRAPYTKRLKDLFDIEGVPVAVYNFGKPGEKTPQMANRLPRLLSDFNARNSLVLILGGTNDYLNLFKRFNHTDADEELSENIISMHRFCQKLNFRTVLMSVPLAHTEELFELHRRRYKFLINVTDFDKIEQLRLRVNRNIQMFAESHRGDVLFIDLAMFVDAHKDDQSFWDKDGLHFSKHGYDLMGEYIFERIKYFVKLELKLTV